jgi:7-cyano-7-deazaguanine synthase
MKFASAVMTTIDSAAIAELLANEDTSELDAEQLGIYFEQCISKLKGSYAILAVHSEYPDRIFVACNYRPIWYARNEFGLFFASSAEYFPSSMIPQMVTPYSSWVFTFGTQQRLDKRMPPNKRALVVCSGGMDSVVAATWAKHEGYGVELIHFRYGSRAEGPEQKAISAVASALGVNLRYLPMAIYDPSDSPLLQADSTIAGGEEGAEYAHEWVPARNLVMLSLATAYAEAKGFDSIILGNNLEEAGAYPDNEPEFIRRFNEMLPFAVGDGKQVRVLMPVGNLMKHEIVALGHQLGAPLHLTWSCYRAGEKHCGTCGPCYMRRTAFRINGLPEVIEYEEGN